MKLNAGKVILFGIGLLPLAGVGGCVVHERGPHVRGEIIIDEPPPPRREVIVAAPSPDHVWINGYWAWHHGRYEWVSGHWIARPHHGAAWVEGHWAREGRGWVWVEGYWR